MDKIDLNTLVEVDLVKISEELHFQSLRKKWEWFSETLESIILRYAKMGFKSYSFQYNIDNTDMLEFHNIYLTILKRLTEKYNLTFEILRGFGGCNNLFMIAW